MNRISTRTLTLLAMFTAAQIILARVLGFYLTDTLRVSFEYFVIVLAGICLGPFGGAVVGGLGDFIGSTILSGLGFFPPFILGPILAGFTAGVLARYVFRGSVDAWWKVMVITCVSELLGNLLCGSWASDLWMGTGFLALLIMRTPVKLGIMIIDGQFVYAVHRALRPLLRRGDRM
ncbi:MAG: folate family ECF transporter S component [Eubacteriales bacterium]|nr:folate family ECF transporter S component [Eubacteriales bacterium]